MTDVPQENGAPGTPPTQPWDPSGIRRSNFTSPPPDAEPPTFDDDALADAMAAEVSTYTSEIKLPWLRSPAPPALVEPARFSDSATTPETSPIPATTGSDSAAGPSQEGDQLLRAWGGASTLEAMDRLEHEFRRIAAGEPPSLELPPATDESVAIPAPPALSETGAAAFEKGTEPKNDPSNDPSTDPTTDVFAWLSSATTAAGTTAAAHEPVVPAFGASIFDVPGAVPISRSAEQNFTPDAPNAEPVEIDVDELPDLPAMGGARLLTDPGSFAPLPGTDTLGWNTTQVIRSEPDGDVDDHDDHDVDGAGYDRADNDRADNEVASSPFAPGTEVWSLFPDESLPVSEPAEPEAVGAPAQSEAPAEAPPEAFAWLFPSAASIPASIDEPTLLLGEPSPDGANDEPVAFESLASATAAIPIVAPSAFAPAFSWLPPVDESLIDQEAATEAAADTRAASIPAPAPAPPESWMTADATEEGVWDLSAPEPTSEAPAGPNPRIAAAAAAAAERVLPDPALGARGMPIPLPSVAEALGPEPIDPTQTVPLAPAESPELSDEASTQVSVEPFALPQVEPLPPAPIVLSSDSAPQFGVAVPYSLEPPLGPESPDWLDAPPPVYTPPELVEPPELVDGIPSAALDPVSPITANTMARLPIPLPAELPKFEDRAELPPPPGYEDIPIMSSDAAAQSTTAASVFFPPMPETALVPLLSVVVATDVPAVPAEPAIPPAPALLETSLDAATTAVATGIPEATESRSLDEDDDDVIDEVDRVSGTGAIPISALHTFQTLAALSEPIATVRLTADQPALGDRTPKELSAFDVETAGLEPTTLDLRAGRAARLFWLWFAANSSVISLGLGAVLLGTGMSLRQSIVATLAGVAISFLPLGLGTLAGKWSGQPTMVVSRATFGHSGNILPAVLAVITRIFWGGVLLWLLATAVAQVLVGAGLDAGLGTTVWQFVGLVSGFVIATVVAMFGYGFVAKLQLVLSTVNGLLILGAAALTFQHLNFAAALTAPDGSWVLAIGGASIVFSVIGLAWVHSSSDIARYQRPGSSGGASMLWATFGATLPPFLLICWGAMLAASDPALAAGLQTNPLAAIASLLPLWYPAPLLAAASLGLLSGAVLTIYSGGFALQALGVRMRRDMSTLVSALLVLAAAGALLFLVSDFSTVVRSLIITIAVPVAAWAGIFAAEMMIRTRRFHTPSLLAAGGIYPQVRWLNLIALVVVSAIGYGFVTSNVIGLQWQGFFFTAIGVAPGDPVGSSNAGVFVALVLGLLVPLAGGISTIRRQETSVPGAAHSSHAAPVITAAPAPTTGSVAVATPDQTHSTIPAD